jgi:hypothetical protein
MNYAQTSKKLAAKGRNGDSMLVHMTPSEVGGLQALALAHGTSMTTNPTTGLPEAFKLKSLLPMLAGFALAPLTAGTSLAFLGASPLAAGMTVGGVEALRTGDIGKGLLAGLGAYGGSGLGSALTSTGAQAATTAALPVGGATATGIPGLSSATPGLVPTQASLVPGAASSSFVQGAGSSLPSNIMSSASTSALENAAANQFASQGFGSQIGQGAQAAANNPNMFMSNLSSQFPSSMGKAAAGIGLAQPFIPPPPEIALPEEEELNYEGPYTPTERQVRYPGPSRSSREFMYFNPSNPIPYAEGGETTDRAIRQPGADYNVNQGEFDYGFKPVEIAKAVASGNPNAIGGKGAAGANQVVGYTSSGEPIYARNQAQGDLGPLGAAMGGKGAMSSAAPAGMSSADAKKFGYDKYTDPQGYKYDPDTQQLVQMAKGGSVPMLEDGGFVLTKKAVDGIGRGNNTQGQKTASRGLGAIPIRGKGNGTSDSIKTSIENKIPARVSNGEAYVPKKNVNRAGGANKLYALMKKAERKV